MFMCHSNVPDFNPATSAVQQMDIYSKKYEDLSSLANKLFEDLKACAVRYKLDDDLKIYRFMILNILKEFYNIDWNFNDITFTERQYTFTYETIEFWLRFEDDFKMCTLSAVRHSKGAVIGCRQFDVVINVGDDEQITLFQPSPRTLPECRALLIEILSKFHNELLDEIICNGLFNPTTNPS